MKTEYAPKPPEDPLEALRIWLIGIGIIAVLLAGTIIYLGYRG